MSFLNFSAISSLFAVNTPPVQDDENDENDEYVDAAVVIAPAGNTFSQYVYILYVFKIKSLKMIYYLFCFVMLSKQCRRIEH